ncbi:hypothetical protein N9980_00525 [bacterium]|nr:hypothetical protein [bacterium]
MQLLEFDETVLAPDKRCLMIRNSGSGGGNFLVREPAYTIAVFSKAAKGDLGATLCYIELVKEWLSTNYTKDCIMSVNIIGDTAGPYILGSGRRAYELNLNVITDTGVTR